MDSRNETSLRSYRFLNETYFSRLYDAFIEAFSDYVIPFALTEAQFRNHIVLNAVDLDRTIGCVEGEKLIGFSLNGFGEWRGRSTVYDAGTGVIPDFRRQGVSEAMFDLMLPIFKDDGVEQCLLEVVTTNTGAIKLYEKLGFQTARELALLECKGKLDSSGGKSSDAEIHDIAEPDWSFMRSFWDGGPSWQNTVEAVVRSTKMKRILGAFLDGRCVGYIVFSAKFGRVAQLAVDKNYRRQRVGTALMRALQADTAEGQSPQVINIDKSLTGAMGFFRSLGFAELLSQYEMIKPM